MKGIQKALLCFAVVVLMLFTGFKWGDKLGKPIYEFTPDIDLSSMITELPKISPKISFEPLITPSFSGGVAVTSAPGLDFDFDIIDPSSVDIWLPTPDITIYPDTTVTAAPTTTITSVLPIITKDPTDETVNEGGECWFIANYSNALYAVWHFISPDGKTDYRYDDPPVSTQFPGLKIENGMYSNLHLSNIPYALNGCEYPLCSEWLEGHM